MSRIGKKEILVAGGVDVSYKGGEFKAQGPKGTISLNLPPGLKLNLAEKQIKLEVIKPDEKKLPRGLFRSYMRQRIADWGTFRQLVNNAITGVSAGFSKKLILEGVGFRASVANNKLTLNLGYSHPINYELAPGINAKVEGNTKIEISGCDKYLVGKTAAEIRSFYEPEPYKGKGVRYEDEVIRRKAGKTGKK